MCRDADDPYDACVGIRVPFCILAHRIFHRGRIVELNNRKVSSVFARTAFDRVRYEAIVHHHSAGVAPAPDPFQKDPFFERQSEARIVLYPKEQIDLKQMTVQLPRPAPYRSASSISSARPRIAFR
jgi:hypothetical protein